MKKALVSILVMIFLCALFASCSQRKIKFKGVVLDELLGPVPETSSAEFVWEIDSEVFGQQFGD